MRWIVFIVQVVQIYFEMRVLKEGDESFFSNWNVFTNLFYTLLYRFKLINE